MANANTTSKKTGNKKIRFDQFKKQLEEIGISNLQEVELAAGQSIWMRLGNSIDSDDAAEFGERIQDCETSEEVALVVLDFHPDGDQGMSAQEQLDAFKKAGGTADQLAALWTSATKDQQARLGKVRVKRA